MHPTKTMASAASTEGSGKQPVRRYGWRGSLALAIALIAVPPATHTVLAPHLARFACRDSGVASWESDWFHTSVRCKAPPPVQSAAHP